MSELDRPRVPWIHSLAEHSDDRGTLVELTTAGGPQLRWCRVFSISVADAISRGGHAHRNCAQGLVAMAGSIRVKSFNGVERSEFRLTRRSEVLVVPPLNWLDLEFDEASTLLVLADRPYEADDYVYRMEDFLLLAGPPAAPPHEG